MIATFICLLLAPPSGAAQADFLQQARITSSKKTSDGTTGSRQATLGARK